MPVEREFKYILKDPEILWKLLNKKPKKLKAKIDIKQAYLSKGGRIRSRSFLVKEGKDISDNPFVEYIFTYKHDLSKQPGCLEIETNINKDDFELAWSESDHQIDKTRFVLSCNKSGGVWEIDFFRDAKGIYLALAEFEVPAETGPPDRLNPLVEEFLTFAVPEDDRRFQNRKLCERAKVEKLLKEIV